MLEMIVTRFIAPMIATSRHRKSTTFPYCGARHMARIQRQIDNGQLKASNGYDPDFEATRGMRAQAAAVPVPKVLAGVDYANLERRIVHSVTT